MTNKHTHHLNQRVFHRQPDSPTVQQLPTNGLVLTDKHTTSGGDAGLPHYHPLNAEGVVISRVSVRKPADQTPKRPEARTPHQRLAEKGRGNPLHKREGVLLQPASARLLTSFGTRSTKRPDTGQIRHTIDAPQEGRALRDPDSSRKTFTHDKRPPRGVRQDKARFSSARKASRQPASVTKVTRALFTNNKVVRSQNNSGVSQKFVRVTLWVDPAVKAHFERLAIQQNLSLSAVGAAFIRSSLQRDVELEYSDLLSPIIEKAIARQMSVLTTRLTWLLVRIAFDAGQTRCLVTNILGRQQGVTQPLLKTILEGSGRSAKANIMRRTPQITSLISSVEKWMTEDDAHGKKAV